MNSKQLLRVAISVLILGGSTATNAGIFGFGDTSWKEEVLLHDGSKIIVERSQSYGGRREVGQSAPIKEHTLTFRLPHTDKPVVFKSEFSQDVGRATFNLLALHVLNGIPYVVAEPNLCVSYNKWGRPNPPYVVFKHDGKSWQRIPMTEFPVELKTINLSLDIRGRQVEELVEMGMVSADTVKQRNAHTEIPQFKSILREAMPQAQINQMCMEMVPYKGSWVMPNDPAARKFIDQQKR